MTTSTGEGRAGFESISLQHTHLLCDISTFLFLSVILSPEILLSFQRRWCVIQWLWMGKQENMRGENDFLRFNSIPSAVPTKQPCKSVGATLPKFNGTVIEHFG